MQPTPQVYQPVPQRDQSYAPTQAGYFPHSGPGKGAAGVIPHPDLSPGQKPPLPQRHSTANSSLLSPNSAVQGSGAAAGRDSYKIYSPTSPTLTEVDGSERPLPEADSIQRPLSNHTGTSMVSPIEASSGTGSPPPTNGQSSYVDPRPGTYEDPKTLPNSSYGSSVALPLTAQINSPRALTDSDQIFGASGHIGRSVAKAALSHNDLVTAVGRLHEDTIAAVESSFRPFHQHCLPLLCDVRIRSTVDAVIEQSIAHFGRIDVIAICTGYGVIGACEDQDDYDIRNQFETNFFGT
ncbi:MAG: hypothetical protein Q9206_005815, partial [Seirophora lacunosa]